MMLYDALAAKTVKGSWAQKKMQHSAAYTHLSTHLGFDALFPSGQPTNFACSPHILN